jgi:hypothetical protein
MKEQADTERGNLLNIGGAGLAEWYYRLRYPEAYHGTFYPQGHAITVIVMDAEDAKELLRRLTESQPVRVEAR